MVFIPVEARVKQLTANGMVAERLDPMGSAGLLTVPYAEGFLGREKLQHFAGLARCGDEVVRVGDVILVCQTTAGIWTRRPIQEHSRRCLAKGAEIVANARVEEIESDSLILATTEGLTARCSLSAIGTFLREKGSDPAGDLGSELLQGGIRIGDPLAGFLKATDDPVVFELDVVGYLARLETDPVIGAHRQALSAEHAARLEFSGGRTPLDSGMEVACPPNLGTVLIIDDEPAWSEKTRKWLEKAGANVVVLPPARWPHAKEEAKKANAKWIIVDVILKERGSATVSGVQIAATLLTESAPWKVILFTIAPGITATAKLPKRVIGPVEKTESMDALASVLRGAQQATTPSAEVAHPAARKWQPHRDQDRTARQIDGLLQIAESCLGAKMALFSYHILADRATFCAGSATLRDAFSTHDHRMQKSQIRDLAFEASDEAWVAYPPSAKGEWWFWLRRLPPEDISHAVGVRLSTPKRDEVWSLFAFWPDNGGPPPSVVLDAFASGKERDLIRGYASAIEDALWHVHLDSELERARKEFEVAQRSQNLAHEVRHEVKEIHARLGGLSDSGVTSDPARVNAIAADCRARCEHLHAVSGTLLQTANPRDQQHRILDVLEECVLRHASQESPADLLAPRVEPEDLQIVGQKDLLVTLVDNLLRNAVQAIRQAEPLRPLTKGRKAGQILVEALRCAADERRVEILIHDTGCGISRYAEKRMYDRWFSTCNGTGLGMGICQEAVRRLGGRLDVKETARFVGTTFRILLPTVRTSARKESSHESR